MKATAIAAGGLCLLLLLGAPGGLVGPDSASAGAGLGVTAEGVRQPGLPLEVNNFKLYSDIVTREVTLRYTVTNRADDALKHITLLVLVFDPDSHVRAVEKASERLNLSPGQQEDRTLRLSNLLYVNPTSDYGRYVVAVDQAQTERGAWRQSLSIPELAAAMNVGGLVPVEQAEATAASDCPGFCIECRNWAQQLCGPGCIQSFTCNLSQCICSFECRAGCHPG